MATILIVDDDADSRDILGRLLRHDGHRVIGAAEGKQAIDLLTARDAALVVLDIRMPGMDGIEFLSIIRSYRRWKGLPVIILSGLPDEDRERAAKHGVRHVLEKGRLDFDTIREIVRNELKPAPAPARPK